MTIFTFYKLPFLLLFKILKMKPTIFNSELWNTSYWYKSCGFYAAQNRNVIFPKTSKMPKPFHWGYFSYTIPSTFTFRYFDTVFVFIFSILSILNSNRNGNLLSRRG